MEFFFQPCPDTDARFVNVEVNALGVAHIGIGEGRHGRTVLQELPKGVCPAVSIMQGKRWSIRYKLPFDWIRSLFPDFAPGPGMRIRGNFYKCDESIHPHFGCWRPIEAPQPDFHRPDFFGEIILD